MHRSAECTPVGGRFKADVIGSVVSLVADAGGSLFAVAFFVGSDLGVLQGRRALLVAITSVIASGF
jgi:hypothetical protein